MSYFVYLSKRPGSYWIPSIPIISRAQAWSSFNHKKRITPSRYLAISSQASSISINSPRSSRQYHYQKKKPYKRQNRTDLIDTKLYPIILRNRYGPTQRNVLRASSSAERLHLNNYPKWHKGLSDDNPHKCIPIPRGKCMWSQCKCQQIIWYLILNGTWN